MGLVELDHTEERDLNLRLKAIEIAVRYDVSRDRLLVVAHGIFIWLKQGTEEAANCHWIMNDAK